ncbi:unnamed protein product [Linum tenue]|uniref:Uncharacterized protein n=1 Tax=Linum tenue TaxID=586396 RepID=A0AAV0P5E7_9ROSI|nr:unnamed protein product [Linum tenue]
MAITIVLLVLVAGAFHGVAAARPLHGDKQKWRGESFLRIHQSLQRGPVTPSKPSPCGHTPGGTGHCPLMNEMN